LRSILHSLIAFTGIVCVSLLPGKACAQLVINEVCSKNNVLLADAFGHYPDWIELHNAGSDPVELDQYHLSDRFDQPTMWRLPEITLAPDGYIVLFAAHSESGTDHFSFAISQSGETVFLFDQVQTIAHSMAIPPLQADHSYGPATSDGALRYFAVPTPGSPNTSEGFLGYAQKPWTSKAAGPVPQNTVLFLYTAPGSTIQVTLDGKIPDESTPAYVGSLLIPNTMVVKARSLSPGLLPSEVMTATYFVNEPRGMPVFSITVDPDSMFHEEFGLYMMGPNADTLHPFHGANFWVNRHIPAYIEYFDEQGNESFAQQVDLRMHGGSQARTKPQRALRLTARKRYGSALVEFPFFPEYGRADRYKHLLLRNSGGDFGLANFRDGLWHQISLHGGLDLDALGFKPVQVFINGNYWGMMNLRERVSRHHVANHYDLPVDSILLMQNENLPMQGDTIHFATFDQFIRSNDLSDPAVFEAVADQLDIASFKDYFALEIFAGNVDWPANNVRYWKPSITEGKWRYLLQDLDATMNVFGWITMDVDMFDWILVHREGFTHSEIFRSLLANAEFKRTFLNRLADLMNTTLCTPSLMSEVDRITDASDNEVPRHYSRWGQDIGSRQLHAGVIIPEFMHVRGDHVREHVLETFDLPNTAMLHFEAFPPGAGTIALNTIVPELPFDGIYFNGNKIDLAATAEPGYVFDHWRYSAAEDSVWHTSTIQKSFPTEGRITAYFRSEGTTIRAFPVPCLENVSLSVESPSEGTATFILSDAHGRDLGSFTQALQSGVNNVPMNMGPYASGIYLLTVRSEMVNGTVRIVRSSDQ
jgi:hypothetical protein